MIAETNPVNTEQATLKTVLELATREVFELMVQTKLELRNDESAAEDLDITAMIGMAGSLCGLISIRCNSMTAKMIAAKMLGVSLNEADLSLRDAAAEIVNMTAGNFKSKLSGSNQCMLSIPTVITGADYQLRSVDVGQIVQLCFSFDGCPINVAMELHS